MEKSLLVKFLGENPIFKIIDFLIENKGLDLTKKEIIEGANISRASLFKVWRQLEKQEIVLVTRQFGKTKLYTINSKNPLVKKLLEIESILIEKSLEKDKLIQVSA
jgi:predicted transcriptional regulator